MTEPRLLEEACRGRRAGLGPLVHLFAWPRSEHIVISGAREHNLKGIDLELPRNALIVMTGLSGSGKSSLAFDTIYAEGQRRYVESLSAYARQFLGLMEKPDVDSIEGLSPAISIDQKTTSRNPRSTVGTVTEIYDYLRLLWARIGKPHCPECGEPIEGQSIEQITDRVMTLPEGTRFMVMAPVVRGRKGEYGKLLEQIRLEGYSRVRVDGELRRLDEEIKLDKKYKHDISVVVDRLVMKNDLRRRLSESIEAAAALAGGVVEVDIVKEGAEAAGAGDDLDRRQGRRASCPATSPTGSPSPSASPASTAAPRSPSSSRGSSPSTRPTAPASAATGSASSASSTPSWSCPTRRCRWPRARCSRGAPATRATGSAWSRRSPRRRGSTSTRPGRSSRTTSARSSSTAPARERHKVSYRNRFGRRRSYSVRFEGIVNNLERRYEETDSDARPRAGRGLHGRAALSRLRGRAAAAREPRGQGRRDLDRRLHASSRRVRRSSGSTSSS